MIPWWLQCLQAFALIAIAAVGAWLAWQQVQMARVKLQHDLYERRYRVFEAARKLLAETQIHRSPSDDDLRAFVIGTSDAVFLFDDDIAVYLKEMQKRAYEFQSLEKLLEVYPDTTPIIPVGEKRTQAVNASSEHFLWFSEQFDGLVDKFKPFLKLDQSR
jgi:hypothetical protein